MSSETRSQKFHRFKKAGINQNRPEQTVQICTHRFIVHKNDLSQLLKGFGLRTHEPSLIWWRALFQVDLAKEDEQERFMHDIDGPSIKSRFFSKLPEQTGTCVMVGKAGHVILCGVPGWSDPGIFMQHKQSQ